MRVAEIVAALAANRPPATVRYLVIDEIGISAAGSAKIRGVEAVEIGVQRSPVLSLDPLILAALPLAVRTVRNGSCPELIWRQRRAGHDTPRSVGFEGRFRINRFNAF